jgi:transcriptional regulator with XRE-family HTH domain
MDGLVEAKKERGHRVRLARESRGITQKRLVVLLAENGYAVDPRDISRIESGDRGVSALLAEKLAFALGVDSDWIYRGTTPQHRQRVCKQYGSHAGVTHERAAAKEAAAIVTRVTIPQVICGEPHDGFGGDMTEHAVYDLADGLDTSDGCDSIERTVLQNEREFHRMVAALAAIVGVLVVLSFVVGV